MLLNHSSGLMGMVDNNGCLLGDNDTYYHDNFLENLKNQRLKHAPGERSIYCNDSLTLAEILVERVSGMGFTRFLEQYFLDPLGLDSIKTPQSDFDRNLLASIYMGNSELKPENVNLIGSGGMYASMEDLCRYAGRISGRRGLLTKTPRLVFRTRRQCLDATQTTSARLK
jgi:CubicO group peptidase (beta-lactamase class C family)